MAATVAFGSPIKFLIAPDPGSDLIATCHSRRKQSATLEEAGARAKRE